MRTPRLVDEYTNIYLGSIREKRHSRERVCIDPQLPDLGTSTSIVHLCIVVNTSQASILHNGLSPVLILSHILISLARIFESVDISVEKSLSRGRNKGGSGKTP